jgi:hypothetical protein
MTSYLSYRKTPSHQRVKPAVSQSPLHFSIDGANHIALTQLAVMIEKKALPAVAEF